MSDAYEHEDDAVPFIRLTDKAKNRQMPPSENPDQARVERVILAILEAAGDNGLPEDLAIKLAVRVDELLVQELAMAEMTRRFKEEFGD